MFSESRGNFLILIDEARKRLEPLCPLIVSRLLPLIGSSLWYCAGLKLFEGNIFLPLGENALPATAIASGVLVTGKIADALTTIHATRSARNAQLSGVHYPLVETTTVFFSHHPGIQEFFGRKHLLFQLTWTAFGTMFPPVGLGLGIGGLMTAAQNELLRQQTNRQIRKNYSIEL